MQISALNFYYKSSEQFKAKKNIFSDNVNDSFIVNEPLQFKPKANFVSFGGLAVNSKNIRLLDCTLRDGGFINDWKFGHDKIIDIFQRLDKANVDVIEVGYINNKSINDLNRSKISDINGINAMFQSVRKKGAKISAMIDYGTCDSENICNQKDSFVDIIRLAFKKDDADSAIELAKEIKGKGYSVFMQPTSVTSYSDDQMLKLVKKINQLNPDAMSIVDTYALLDKKELNRYFSLLNKNLNSNIDIGFHAHNNMQLGFSNAMELAHKKTNRKVYLDSSLFGMGKSAGNVTTELLSMKLNKECGKQYNMNNILEAIDKNILPMFGDNKWGYSFLHFVSALNGCHHNYVAFLRAKNLSISEINDIVKTIEKDKKLEFDEKYVESLFLSKTRNT